MLNRETSKKLALEYLLDSELDDFEANPSQNHVYFHAMLALHGLSAALDALEEANNGNDDNASN